MTLSNKVWAYVCCLPACFWVSGCGTLNTDRASISSEKSGTERADFDSEDRSPEAVERRTEAHARYATGVLFDWEEEPELASEEFYKAVMSDPGNGALALEVSQRLIQLKKYDKAVEVLVKATAFSEAPGILHAQLGRVYSLIGKKELAIEANKTAIRKMPKNMMGYRNLAQILLQNQQPEEGLKVLEQASKQTGTDAGFLTELGEVYTTFIRAGGSDTVKKSATSAFERAAETRPTNPILLQRLGDGFALVGVPDKAAECYLKVLERFPSLPGLREKLVEIYLRQDDRKRATEQLETILRSNPTNPQYYYLLGSIAYEDKRPKEAIELFSKTMLLNPEFEPVYYDMAGAQLNANQPKEALDTLRKARSKFATGFICEFFTALAYGRMDDYTNALKYYTAAEIVGRANETNRLTHTFYFQLGAAYERTHNFEDAEKYLRKSIDMSPDFSDGLNYLGYMWADRGVRLPEARTMIEKALKLEPKNAAYLDSMAWVLFKQGESKEALAFMLKAVDLNEQPDATLFDHLGDIYAELKQPDKARESWRKALDIKPTEEIKKKLEARRATQVTTPK